MMRLAGGHQQPDPLLSGVAREAFKLRAEIVERSFAHNLDRGGMRRTWLRAARTCTSDTCFTSPATTYRC